MAGQDLYLGKMMESLLTELESVKQAMNVQVSELQTVASLISMGTVEVNVIPSASDIKVYVNDTEETMNSTTPLVLGQFKSFCNGSISFGGTVIQGYPAASNAVYLKILINDVVKGTITATFGQTITEVLPISVAKGDVLKITLTSTATSIPATVPANGAYIEYKYLSIENDGAISRI